LGVNKNVRKNMHQQRIPGFATVVSLWCKRLAQLHSIVNSANQRGRFIQITEDVVGRRKRVMVQMEAFADFGIGMMRLLKEAEKMPPFEAGQPAAY
jgi:hypothetical protein